MRVSGSVRWRLDWIRDLDRSQMYVLFVYILHVKPYMYMYMCVPGWPLPGFLYKRRQISLRQISIQTDKLFSLLVP